LSTELQVTTLELERTEGGKIKSNQVFEKFWEVWELFLKIVTQQFMFL